MSIRWLLVVSRASPGIESQQYAVNLLHVTSICKHPEHGGANIWLADGDDALVTEEAFEDVIRWAFQVSGHSP
jgi:hypothetical protein